MLLLVYSFVLLLLFIFIFTLYYLVLDLEVMKLLPPVLPMLLLVALFTLLESKMLGGMQSSSGPNVVGMFGLLQPFADAFKLIFKETMIPGLSNLILFMIAPMMSFSMSLLSWSMMPLSNNVVLSDINLGLMFLFSISSLGVYGIIMSGWSSNSKYAFLGALSSAAQFISYEVSIGMIVMTIMLCTGSLNLTDIVLFQSSMWFMFVLFPSFIMFFISALAETNSIPFDLPEAESELVSGYNVEYSATTFVLFFLAEYSNILMMSVMLVMLFLGGWLPFYNIMMLYYFPGWLWFSMKVYVIVFMFIIMRGTLPRYSYDQLMNIGWKVLLPLSLSYLFFVSTLFWLL